MKTKLIICFFSVGLMACDGGNRSLEKNKDDSITPQDAKAIGMEIQDIHEDLTKRRRESDSVFNELINDIDQQLEIKSEGFKKFKMDSSMKESDFIIEKYKD